MGRPTAEAQLGKASLILDQLDELWKQAPGVGLTMLADGAREAYLVLREAKQSAEALQRGEVEAR